MESFETQVEGVVSSHAQSGAGSLNKEKRARPSRGEAIWQKRLLPLMVGMLVTLTAFFFVASFVQLYYLQTRIEHAPQLDLSPAMASLDAFEKDLKSGAITEAAAMDSRLGYARWRTLSLLEANALERRYHQAGVLLISRIWTRYLGFVTGTILALVGAAFILGKLREGSSNVGLEGVGFKASIVSASPGLVLAVLGTALMLATLGTNLEMQVNDGPVYLTQPARDQIDVPAAISPEDKTQVPRSDTDILNKLKKEGESKR